MASSDLERYFNIILSADGGEEVRDAIINAAKLMKTTTKNAGSLGGHTPDYFALANPYLIWYENTVNKFGFDDIDDLADAAYARSSTNVVSSATLYGVLLKYMKPAFKAIFNYENDPNDSKEAAVAITDYLSKLVNIKSDIGKALKSKGKKLTQAKDFRYYAELIRTIDEGIPELVDPDDFTEIKEYDAMEGKNYPAAYSRFRVKLDKTKYLVEGSGDENGQTYKPPEGKLFSSFNVNVKTRSGANSTARSATGKRGKSSTGDSDVLDENGMLENFVITENDTYYASDAGAEGFKSVSVHVTEPEVGDQKFTVTFYNGEDQLDQQTVVAYDSAYYSRPTPVSKEDPNNKIFSGWIPSPARVTQNLDCQAQFIDRGTPTPEEIQDSWTEIVRNGGSSYNYGAYKPLTIGTIGGKNFGTLIMEKVGMGEGPSSSTWVSKTCLTDTLVGGAYPWPESDARAFLNGTFLEYMAKTADGLAIVNGLIPVRKASIVAFPRHTYDDNVSYGILHTTDRLWIPSFAEMFGTESYTTSYEGALKAYHDETTTNDTTGPEYPSEDLRDSFCYVENSTASVTWTRHESTPKHYNIQYSISSPGWFTKYSCTNTSQVVDYGLRSVCRFGHTNGMEDYYPMYYIYKPSQNKLDSSKANYIGSFPIGFCL